MQLLDIQRAKNVTQTRDPQLGRQLKDVNILFEVLDTCCNFVLTMSGLRV